MLMEDYINTANINDKWLDNVYENIKALEEYERLIREGCKSLLDFLNIPYKNRPVIIGDTQFKNIKFFLTEFKLLLGDLSPILGEDDEKSFYNIINKIDDALKRQDLFITNKYDLNNNLIEVVPTKFFWETVEALHRTKVDLFRKIKHILYIG